MTDFTPGVSKQCRGPSTYKCINGILYSDRNIKPSFSLKVTISKEYHSTPTGEHVGLAKAYSVLSANLT